MRQERFSDEISNSQQLNVIAITVYERLILKFYVFIVYKNVTVAVLLVLKLRTISYIAKASQ